MLNEDYNLDSPYDVNAGNEADYQISPQQPLNLDTPSQPESSVNQFEVDALDILDSTNDYQSGISELIDNYKSKKFDDPIKAKEILETYSKDLQFKTKQPGYDTEDIITVAPVKMSDVPGETPVERIDNWEQQNLKAINDSEDPDYIASKHQLTSSISNTASQARREQYNGGTGLAAWGKDAYYRAKEGAIGGFAKLAGADDEVRSLHEHTNENYDTNFFSKLSGAAGFLAPSIAAGVATGGAAVLPLLAAQSAGEVREAYKNSIDATGDTTRAIQSSLLTGAAQAVNFIPLGRIVGAAVKTEGAAFGKVALEGVTKVATEELDTGVAKTLTDGFVESLEKAKAKNFKDIPLSALEAGTAGAAGNVIGNYGANVGLDKNGDITNGTWDAFLTNATLGGVLTGAHALVENYQINKFQDAIKELNTAEESVTTSEETSSTKRPGTAIAYRELVDETELNHTSIPKLEKDEDGHWIEKDEPPTPEQVEADRVFYERAKEEYINEKPPEHEEYASDLQDESGDPVGVEHYPDEVVASLPHNTVMISDDANQRSPSTAMTYFARAFLGASLKLRKNIINGAFGAYSTGNKDITVLRSLGADPAKLNSTLAHEIGHFLDADLNEAFKSNALRSMAEKLKGTRDLWYNDLSKSKKLNKQAKELSMEWRPGWDGQPGDSHRLASNIDQFRAYRSQPEEQYADTFSALVNTPDFVKENYPELFNAFEKGLSRNLDLSNFWTTFKKLGSDPAELSRFHMQVRYESRSKDANIRAANALDKMRNNSRQAQFIRAKNEAYEAYYNKYRIAKGIVNRLKGPARETGFQFLLDIKRQDYIKSWQELHVDKGLNRVFSKAEQAEIPLNSWAHYEGLQHIINDKTNTMVNVDNDFPLYARAGEALRDMLFKLPGVNQRLVHDYFTPEDFSSPEKLNDAFAKVNIIADSAQVLHVSQFLDRFDPADPKRQQKAQGAYRRAVANLNKRRTSIPMELLRKQISQLPKNELRDALEDVTSEGAFNARKYLVNADGATIYDAQRDLTTIRQDLGPKKFQALQKISNEYHQVLNRMLPDIIKSGKFSPELQERILNNKDTYIHTLVLKHFEGGDAIDGSIRQSVGSLSETGNELTSTADKMKAIHALSIRQSARNNAVNIAKQGGVWVEGIKAPKVQDTFQLRDKLSREDADHSYIVSYAEGSPAINKLSGGKSWENIFKSDNTFPGLEMGLQLSDSVNKLLSTHLFKTAASPVWAIRQKMLDRGVEALMSNSFPSIYGFHLSPTRRRADREAKAEIKEWQKTGNLSPALKAHLDYYGSILNIHQDSIDGTRNAGFNESIIEGFGVKLPNEERTLEKISQYTQKALDAVGGKKLKEIIEFDELRAKINGFKIGKERGYSDAEATNYSQENFGLPDAGSGGYKKALVNRVFLFGGAFLNGQRVIGHLIRDTPGTATMQLTINTVLPKLLYTSVGVAALRALMGDDFADKWQIMSDKIPAYHKIGYNLIGMGFTDPQGQFHSILDPALKASDITTEWKSRYLTIPQAREITSLSRIMWPMLDGLATGDMNHVAQGIGKGLVSEGIGSWQPAFQYIYNVGEMAFTQDGPTDWYRQKPIFNRDLQKGGSTLDKTEAYAWYLGSQQLPGIVPYNPFGSDTGKTDLEKFQKYVPFGGPLARTFLQDSNYGDIEKSKNAKDLIQATNDGIERSTGDAVHDILSDYRKAAGQTTSIGKGWASKVGSDRAYEISALTSWHTKIWVPYRNELRAAQSAGDDKRYQELLNELESSASALKSSLKRQE